MGLLDKSQKEALGGGLDAYLEGLSVRLAVLCAQIERERRESELERRVLAESVAILEARLSQVENSLFFRFNRALGTFVKSKTRKAAQRLAHGRFDILRQPQLKAADEQYARWVEWQEAQIPKGDWHKQKASRWTWQPRISLIMATQNPNQEWLKSAVSSVLNQSYDNWELCICDDGSRDAWVAEYLGFLKKSDPRIQVVYSPSQRGESNCLNEAARLAGGGYIARLRQDGVLHPHCLFYLGEACLEGWQVIYVDEDTLDASGQRKHPIFKPGWSPDLLTSCMYWGKFWIAERKSLEQASGEPDKWFRSSFDGSQDYDLALRLTDVPVRVGHVSRVLYHSHSFPNKKSKAELEPSEPSRLALEDAMARRGWSGIVDLTPTPGTFFVHREVCERPLVSIVVCSKNLKLFESFLRQLGAQTRYGPLELVLVEHRTCPKPFPLERLRVAWKQRWVHVPFTGTFNFSVMNNQAAQQANGSILMFLNDDVEPIGADWLERLLAQVQRPEIGIAGARLEYPSGTIQHAGIALGMSLDGAGHPGRFLFRSSLFPWLKVTRNVTAVTGACLAIRKSVYEELGGMDPQFPIDYNDVDLCLRAKEAGYLVVYEAGAVLRHRESASRAPGSRFQERSIFLRRWAHLLQQPDPYMPPALDRNTEAIRLAACTHP